MKKFLFLCAAVAVIAIFNLKCRSSRNDRDPYLGVAVNKAHQKDPPIATQIIITTLPEKNESGTVLFEAALPKEKVGSNMLAILLGDSNKIVLHDDGLNGDKLAGDGMYSTILNVSSDSLGALLRERLITGNKRLSELKNVYRFKGRMEFPENRDNLMRIFNEDNFKKPAIDTEDRLDSEYSDPGNWEAIKADRAAIGFYFLLGEEDGRSIAWSKKLGKVVLYFSCC